MQRISVKRSKRLLYDLRTSSRYAVDPGQGKGLRRCRPASRLNGRSDGWATAPPKHPRIARCSPL